MGDLCSICYMYRCAGQIPIVSCDNDKCALNFHLICLKEWFATVRDTKVFLNMTSGRCPSCKEVSNLNLLWIHFVRVCFIFMDLFLFQKLSTSFNDLLDESNEWWTLTTRIDFHCTNFPFHKFSFMSWMICFVVHVTDSFDGWWIQ